MVCTTVVDYGRVLSRIIPRSISQPLRTSLLELSHLYDELKTSDRSIDLCFRIQLRTMSFEPNSREPGTQKVRCISRNEPSDLLLS